MSSSLLSSSTSLLRLFTTTTIRSAPSASTILSNGLKRTARCHPQWQRQQLNQQRTITTYRVAKKYEALNKKKEDEQFGERLIDLVENHGWQFRNDEHGAVMKTYKIKPGHELIFFDRLLAAVNEHDHHPVLIWSGDVFSIEWTTHSPPGLSPKDLNMAYLTDEIASDIKQLGYLSRKRKLEDRFWRNDYDAPDEKEL